MANGHSSSVESEIIKKKAIEVRPPVKKIFEMLRIWKTSLWPVYTHLSTFPLVFVL